ncbi:hypothetical protein ACLX1H_006170 [Fusarium chlamydosporum]
MSEKLKGVLRRAIDNVKTINQRIWEENIQPSLLIEGIQAMFDPIPEVGLQISHHKIEKWSASPTGDIPNLKPSIMLHGHQKHAVGKAKWAMNSMFKGMILADPPGLGKTLSALAMIARFDSPERGPSVIVAPSSCCHQWMQEIGKFSKDDTMPAICTVDQELGINRLYQYKIVVTSYEQVHDELALLQRYTQALDDYHKGHLEIQDIPNLPFVTLLMRAFLRKGVKPLGPLLVLDNVHNITDYRTRTFEAICKLRERLEVCIMMSGKPLDKTWMGAYGLFLLLRGHGIGSMTTMGIIQMMDAVTLRRPVEIVSQNLPPLKNEIYQYASDSAYTASSNHCFKEFKQRNESEEQESCWPWFDKARQPISEENREWYETVKEENNWRSERTSNLMTLVSLHRQGRPDDAFVVMDESVFFLDIVQVAISKYFDEEIPVFRYNGRECAGENNAAVERLNAAQGFRILLATRGAGGQGLNLQSANVLIRCGPWLRVSCEQQVERRIHRIRQEKPTFVYELYDENCEVDNYLRKTRESNNRTNSEILDAVTHEDDMEEPWMRSFSSD